MHVLSRDLAVRLRNGSKLPRLHIEKCKAFLCAQWISCHSVSAYQSMPVDVDLAYYLGSAGSKLLQFCRRSCETS